MIGIGCNIFSLFITYVYIQRIKIDWRKKRKKEAWVWIAIGAGSMVLLGSIIVIIMWNEGRP